MKAVNRFINSRRAVVERVIAQIKMWPVLHTGFRRALGSFAGVFFWRVGWCFLGW